MPVIDHSTQPMPEPVDKRSVRALVSAEHGTESLAISELIVHPGSVGRLHTHDSDEAIMVMEGSIQMIVGDEVRTVRSGYTMVAPPGTPHKLVNNTWVHARMIVTHPSNDLQTTYLE
jgi:quercetin dioxygenase-like cupin family protein